MNQKKPTFEQSMSRLEEIIAALEKGETPLADALTLFEEGAGLLRHCSETLEQAEQTIARLQKDADGLPEEIVLSEDHLET
ncbi:MAG: exodeoxyribonuclease VII small subunit [Oscillospiraceae bacterium]|nr:exodeoxyribonuclease VII small subunit [Oscillospiraceae bacterium]